MGVGFNTFKTKVSGTKFVVQNNSSRTLGIFTIRLMPGRQYDLMNIPQVSEADIRHSLLKGALLSKLRTGELRVIESTIDLSQFDSEQEAFLQSVGVDTGLGSIINDGSAVGDIARWNGSTWEPATSAQVARESYEQSFAAVSVPIAAPGNYTTIATLTLETLLPANGIIILGFSTRMTDVGTGFSEVLEMRASLQRTGPLGTPVWTVVNKDEDTTTNPIGWTVLSIPAAEAATPGNGTLTARLNVSGASLLLQIDAHAGSIRTAQTDVFVGRSRLV